MQSSFLNKKNGRSISRKIVVAFLLGGLAILLSWMISSVTFRQILETVNSLSSPNPKLKLINTIFRDVVRLDQMQRAQALQDRTRAYNPFIKESKHIQYMLDSLNVVSTGNEEQAGRIDSMKLILRERDRLFLNYITLRASYLKNDTLSDYVKNLSKVISDASINIDSSIITTERKITTTTVESPAEEKQSFWDRLFKKKKGNAKQYVKEELNIKVDTLAMGREDSVLKMLGRSVSFMEDSRAAGRSRLINGQLQMIRNGNMLISQLMTILQDIENEELKRVEASNSMATALVNSGLKKISFIILLFIAGTVVSGYLIFTDIARSNEYRAQLVAAKEEAETLGQVKQRFLANMSHELRTPLQSILGIAEQSNMRGSAEKDELNIIYHSSQHLLQIVNELLDHSRITSGKFKFDKMGFDMQQVLCEIREIIEVKASEKGLLFKYTEHEPVDGLYLGDPFRLKQVLLNLLGNAVKFTRVGAVTLEVERELKAKRTVFTYRIKDTGAGIKEDELQNIFNDFEQGENNTQEGTGLGLSISKALAEGMHGHISVESERGKGSSFTLVLPFEKDMSSSTGTKQMTQRYGHTGIVWIVDDDVYILKLCGGILKKYGIEYRCFSKPEDALNDSSIPATVLLDIRLGSMSGITLCKLLKEKFNANNIRYVAMTAQAMEEERANILSAGFDILLLKPFMEYDLMKIISKGPLQQADPQKMPDDLLSKVRYMAAEDEETIKDMISSFVEETMLDMNRLKQAVGAQDATSVTEYIHRLAGRSAQFGAARLAGRLRDAEYKMRKGAEPADIERQLQDIYEEAALLIQQMQAYEM